MFLRKVEKRRALGSVLVIWALRPTIQTLFEINIIRAYRKPLRRVGHRNFEAGYNKTKHFDSL